MQGLYRKVFQEIGGMQIGPLSNIYDDEKREKRKRRNENKIKKLRNPRSPVKCTALEVGSANCVSGPTPGTSPNTILIKKSNLTWLSVRMVVRSPMK